MSYALKISGSTAAAILRVRPTRRGIRSAADACGHPTVRPTPRVPAPQPHGCSQPPGRSSAAVAVTPPRRSGAEPIPPHPDTIFRPVSGHSKWSSIKHKKAIVDSRRGAQFTKLARAVTVAAREGGGDPDANAALANAIQKAKDASMPKDNIERAIAKGTGVGGEAEAIEAVLYEGYGPGGVAVLVQALTDNRNRTGAD